jgi:hypothetical protein
MDDELGQFYTAEEGELHYFNLRQRKGADAIFVSKETKFSNSLTGTVTSKRDIRKVLDKQESGEIVNVKGELVLRCSTGGREQIKVVVHDNDNARMNFVLQQFRGDTGNPFKMTSFYFSQCEFKALLDFLTLVRFIDLSDTNNFKATMSDLRTKVLVDRSEGELLEVLRRSHGEDRIRLLGLIKEENLTKQDIDILTGRRDGLEIFRRKLYVEKDWTEKEWQSFFKGNTWIFGYGLDYRFLSLLQKEASVSDIDLDGSNVATGDFLLGTTDFTVLVELKRPDTQLFDRSQNRSRSWRLSKDLIHAVSQILAQKSAWQARADATNYDENGNVVAQKACDPKCVLIIGSRGQFSDTPRNKDIKLRTFELFRRDSRNIETLTYDELYARAYYLVNQTLPADSLPVENEGE